MRKIMISTSIVGACLLMSGCLFGSHGVIHDREDDYLKSKNNPPLKIPSDSKLIGSSDAYPIPAGPAFSNQKPVSLTPPGLDDAATPTDQANNQISLGQDADGFAELQMPGSDYNLAWKQIHTAVTKAGYQIVGSDKTTGIIAISVISSGNVGADVYQIKVVQDQAATLVSVIGQTGEPADDATAKTILEKLQAVLGSSNAGK
jgi:uncharacterized lipoprotein